MKMCVLVERVGRKMGAWGLGEGWLTGCGGFARQDLNLGLEFRDPSLCVFGDPVLRVGDVGAA